MKNKKLSVWDVSSEEEIRTDLPGNDCRRFNGGEVAGKNVTKFWPSEDEKPSPPIILAVKVIDRLRI